MPYGLTLIPLMNIYLQNQILFPPFLIYGTIYLIHCSIETSRLKSTLSVLL